MSEQVNPVPAEEKESSGLLLSVDPLHEGTKLYATDTVDGGADSDVAGADTDSTDRGDTDLTDAGDTDTSDTKGDSDGSDVTDKIKDALGMDDSDSDSDGADGTVDADGTDRS